MPSTEPAAADSHVGMFARACHLTSQQQLMVTSADMVGMSARAGHFSCQHRIVRSAEPLNR